MVIIVKPGYYFIDALLLAATINNPIISSLAILDTRWEDLRHGPRFWWHFMEDRAHLKDSYHLKDKVFLFDQWWQAREHEAQKEMQPTQVFDRFRVKWMSYDLLASRQWE